MLSGQRLLIVEGEFLIALDIQRVLEDAKAAQTVFARNFEEVAALGSRIGEFDLAIVTPPRPGTRDAAIARQLLDYGVAMVVCSATPSVLKGTPLADAEIVDKPFTDEALLAACRRAMERSASSRCVS